MYFVIDDELYFYSHNRLRRILWSGSVYNNPVYKLSRRLNLIKLCLFLNTESEYRQLPGGGIERSGHGVHTMADGSVFRGNWANDRMNESGSIQFAGGASYEGGILDNSFEGHGRYTWPNGSFFEGTFVKNRSV